MMAATPRAAHNLSRARSFDVGLVIVYSPWSIVKCRHDGWAVKDRGRIRFYRFRITQVYLPRPASPMTKAAACPRAKHTAGEPAALSHTLLARSSIQSVQRNMLRHAPEIVGA
jgi:hypothetical protein